MKCIQKIDQLQETSSITNPNPKTTLPASRSSPLRKLITCLLISTGIWPSVKKKKRLFLQGLFHIIFLLCVLKSTSCLYWTEEWPDLFGGQLFNNLITVILWWNLYLKRIEILNLSELLTTCGARTERKIVKTVALVTLLLYSPLILLVFKLSKQSFYFKTRRAYSCRNYWLPTKFMNRLWPLVFFTELSNSWVSFCPFYVSGTIYCIFCFLALAKNRDVAFLALERRETLVAFVRKIEKTFSFPIFLVIIRIGLTVFVEVSLYFGSSKSAWISNGISSLQVLVWFVIIVALADKVQERCLQDLERCYVVGGVEANPVYFAYKNLKKKAVLTAWKLCVIDRRLVMTFLATVITYSVVISGYKDN